MVTKTEAVRNFLLASTHKDLAELYDYNLEVQVNVAQDGGERVDGDFKGRAWHGYTDNLTTWKPLRIPWKASTDPHFTDSKMTWDLAEHAEAIGMTGWDWANKCSRWVAFDFDAIVGHSEKNPSKLTFEELETIKDTAAKIPWVTIRKSTSGRGLHIYVFVNEVETQTHTEHAALARAILGKMAALTGFDFRSKVDCCGGNMWVWHRKMSKKDGLILVKEGTVLTDVPLNWRDHVDVIKGRRRRNLPKSIADLPEADKFEDLINQRVKIPLEDEHQKLITYLESTDAVWWWDNDLWLLVTHTTHLKDAFDALDVKGIFDTVATGKDKGVDHNCFNGAVEVLTDEGPKTFKELAEVGKATLCVRDLNGNAIWEEVEILKFGQQETVELTFGDQTKIRVTKDHQWLYKDNNTKQVCPINRKTTNELLLGKTELPLIKLQLSKPSEEGRAHGFVTVSSKKEDGLIEDVYCAVVPKYHNFVLANGLVTGNCFLTPLRHGTWSVRRFTPGVQEHLSWTQDGQGWTRCYFNRKPDLLAASNTFGGIESPQGGFVFREAENAVKAAAAMGVLIEVGTPLLSRQTILKKHKDGRLVVTVERDSMDSFDTMKNWLAVKDKPWTRIFSLPDDGPEEVETFDCDDVVRHIITTGNENYGWAIKSENDWRLEPLTHIQKALGALGFKYAEANTIIGSAVFKAWKLVNKPFELEFPGDREWNRGAAQLKFNPTIDKSNLNYPNWLSVLQHCGSGLDQSISRNPWCKVNNILSGCDYLKIWLASLFQRPTEPLPYLFFYGPQDSGKSIFWEAVSELLTVGVKRADVALLSQGGFNKELEGAILCVLDEVDLRRNKLAYNRIKDWVTGRELLIHEKGMTPYHIQNTAHFIHCSNDHNFCPVFPGDTRIVASYVKALDFDKKIPKRKFIPMLMNEAPDFLAELLDIDIPDSNDRLSLPVIETEDKMVIQKMNQTALETFMEESCKAAPGYMIKFSEFYDKFREWVDPAEAAIWTKIAIGKGIPPQYLKARNQKDSQYYIGNIAWTEISTIERPAFVLLRRGTNDFLATKEELG